MPFGVALPIRDAIYQCRQQPCSHWSEDVCLLIGRQDLTKQAHEFTLGKGKSVSLQRETALCAQPAKRTHTQSGHYHDAYNTPAAYNSQHALSLDFLVSVPGVLGVMGKLLGVCWGLQEMTSHKAETQCAISNTVYQYEKKVTFIEWGWGWGQWIKL